MNIIGCDEENNEDPNKTADQKIVWTSELHDTMGFANSTS